MVPCSRRQSDHLPEERMPSLTPATGAQETQSTSNWLIHTGEQEWLQAKWLQIICIKRKSTKDAHTPQPGGIEELNIENLKPFN